MLPPVSGIDCVRALRRAGFQIELDGPDYAVTTTRHGVAVVRVPLVERLRPGQLLTILTLTGITPERFEGYLLE